MGIMNFSRHDTRVCALKLSLLENVIKGQRELFVYWQKASHTLWNVFQCILRLLVTDRPMNHPPSYVFVDKFGKLFDFWNLVNDFTENLLKRMG